MMTLTAFAVAASTLALAKNVSTNNGLAVATKKELMSQTEIMRRP